MAKSRSLNAITKAIAKKVLASAKASVEIGVLLSEAKEVIEEKNEKGATKIFLEWAGDEFGIKKAQAYSYLKIAQVFGSDEMQEKFASVPMMVLGRLCSNDAMLDAALIAIEEGEKVDVKWMKEYLEELKKEEAAQRSAERGASDDSEEEEDEDGEESTSNSKASGSPAGDQFVDELEAKIAELEEKLESAGGEGAGIAATHFSALAKRMSKLEAYQVLGVAPDAGKKDVNKAKRELTKIYHPDVLGQDAEQVMELINAAAKAMTK